MLTAKFAVVVPEILSDDSVAHNVELRDDEYCESFDATGSESEGTVLRLSCLDKRHARRLAKEINKCVSVER